MVVENFVAAVVAQVKVVHLKNNRSPQVTEVEVQELQLQHLPLQEVQVQQVTG